jgi:hypothetical protein
LGHVLLSIINQEASHRIYIGFMIFYLAISVGLMAEDIHLSFDLVEFYQV